MSKATWHKGPPPSLGWWPASITRSSSILRWWNGDVWSRPVDRKFSPEEATRRTRCACKFQDAIEWCDRPDDWPERSRT